MATCRRFCSLIGVLAFLAACQPECECPPADIPTEPDAPVTDKVTGPDGFKLAEAEFSALPGWRTNDISPAIEAFTRSCAVWSGKPPDDLVSTRTVYAGKVSDWLPACKILPKYREAGELYRFFEDYFDVYSVETDEEINKLTGYYEPELTVSEKPTGALTAPVPLRPDDLIEVKLGQFEKELENRTVWGRVENGELVLYPDREGIKIRSDRVLAYAHPTDVFFLQIQGSGRLKFPDGRLVRAGFDAHNHLPFGSLANHLMKTGEITRAEAGMSGIRAWMDKVGPKRAAEAMNVNPRFVFFRETPITDPNEGPDGAAGIPLTPMGSVAVDLSKHPLGLPVFVESDIPDENRKLQTTSLLLIAQDTGGAIKGARRGDIFFGSGDAAGKRAGSMNAPGQFWVFLPQDVSHETLSEPHE